MVDKPTSRQYEALNHELNTAAERARQRPVSMYVKYTPEDEEEKVPDKKKSIAFLDSVLLTDSISPNDEQFIVPKVVNYNENEAVMIVEEFSASGES